MRNPAFTAKERKTIIHRCAQINLAYLMTGKIGGTDENDERHHKKIHPQV